MTSAIVSGDNFAVCQIKQLRRTSIRMNFVNYDKDDDGNNNQCSEQEGNL